MVFIHRLDEFFGERLFIFPNNITLRTIQKRVQDKDLSMDEGRYLLTSPLLFICQLVSDESIVFREEQAKGTYCIGARPS